MEYYDNESLRKILTRSARSSKCPPKPTASTKSPVVRRHAAYRHRCSSACETRTGAGRRHHYQRSGREGAGRAGVDQLRLDQTDRNLLETIVHNSMAPRWPRYPGRSTSEDSETIEDVYEPYLLQLGFIARTPRGAWSLAWAINIWASTRPATDKDKDRDFDHLSMMRDERLAGAADLRAAHRQRFCLRSPARMIGQSRWSARLLEVARVERVTGSFAAPPFSRSFLIYLRPGDPADRQSERVIPARLLGQTR